MKLSGHKASKQFLCGTGVLASYVVCVLLYGMFTECLTETATVRVLQYDVGDGMAMNINT